MCSGSFGFSNRKGCRSMKNKPSSNQVTLAREHLVRCIPQQCDASHKRSSRSARPSELSEVRIRRPYGRRSGSAHSFGHSGVVRTPQAQNLRQLKPRTGYSLSGASFTFTLCVARAFKHGLLHKRHRHRHNTPGQSRFDVRGPVFSQTRPHRVQAAASIVPRQTAAPHAQPKVLRSSDSSTSKL